MGRIIAILALYFSFCVNSNAQDQHFVDSLTNLLNGNLSDTMRINLLNKIASDYFYINPEKINDFANEALKKSEKINYKKGIAQSFNNLGIYYRTKGVYDLAIDYSFNSLSIMENIKDYQGIARCYNLIGIIYYYLENYDLSLEYYSKALVLNKEQNDSRWIAGNYNNIGMIYEKKSDYKKALEFYFKALEANIDLNNKNWIATNYGNIGSLYLEMHNDKSIEFFNKRLEINIEQDDLAGTTRAKYLIGKYFISKQKYDSAVIYLLSSYALADSLGSLLNLSNSSQELSKAYAGMNNYKMALYYNKIYKKYSDSLNIQDNAQKITRIEMQYKYRKDEQLNDLQYQQAKLILISFAVGLFLLVIAILLIFNKQRSRIKQHSMEQKKLGIEKKLLEEELLFKDQLLKDNINYLLSKNELITSVSEKLISKKSNFKKENHKIIDDIFQELQAGISGEAWEEFEIRFNQVHTDFYKNLNTEYPHLSSNDKKLCAFLRLGMATKEISSIMNLPVSSVETARTRLRKKLNLMNTKTNLTEFLSKF